MSRVVFSFSLPVESKAAWHLKEWKREGKVISHVIQNALEYEALEQIELQTSHDRYKRNYLKLHSILLEVFGVIVTDFNFYPPEHKSGGTKLIPGPNQPIDTLKMCRDALKKRPEWIISGEEF